MPHLLDPNFSGTLTYICEHNEDGAMGIIINCPLDLDLHAVLQEFDLPLNAPSQAIYWGGPVQDDRGFILHTQAPEQIAQWDSSMVIVEPVYLTTSRDIIEAISRNQGPPRFLFALGYAGWGRGQLEQELTENVWIACPADDGILFDTDSGQKRTLAIQSMGITEHQLNAQIGHA